MLLQMLVRFLASFSLTVVYKNEASEKHQNWELGMFASQ